MSDWAWIKCARIFQVQWNRFKICRFYDKTVNENEAAIVKLQQCTQKKMWLNVCCLVRTVIFYAEKRLIGKLFCILLCRVILEYNSPNITHTKKPQIIHLIFNLTQFTDDTLVYLRFMPYSSVLRTLNIFQMHFFV